MQKKGVLGSMHWVSPGSSRSESGSKVASRRSCSTMRSRDCSASCECESHGPVGARGRARLNAWRGFSEMETNTRRRGIVRAVSGLVLAQGVVGCWAALRGSGGGSFLTKHHHHLHATQLRHQIGSLNGANHRDMLISDCVVGADDKVHIIVNPRACCPPRRASPPPAFLPTADHFSRPGVGAFPCTCR